MLTREQIARVLYAYWSYDQGVGRAPTAEMWAAFERGDDLNPVHLTKQDFLVDADELLASINLTE